MEIREILEKLPPAPAGVRKWINDEVIENTYLVYNKKEDWVVCSRCGHKYRASRFDITNNLPGVCPRCKRRGIYKASGIGRKNLTEYFRVLIFTHRGNTVYATLTEIMAEFEKPGKPELSGWLSAVYVFSKDEQIYYKHHPECYFEAEHWEKKRKVYLPMPPWGNFYAAPKFWRTEIYEDNLMSVFKKSCLKYAYIPEILEAYEIDAYAFIRYVDLFLKYKSIELLAKSGFDRLVVLKMDGVQGGRRINWKGKSLERILKLPMRHIRKLREMKDIDFDFLSYFQKLSEKEKLLPAKQLEYAFDVEKRWYVDEVKKKVDVMKWAGWAKDQPLYPTIGDWLDYIDDCEKLGMDTRKKGILFPDNFYVVHTEFSKMVEVIENTERNKGIEHVAEEYEFEISDSRYILSMPHAQADLNMESSVLNHCVKNYGDRVARGDTLIYFIRRKEEPDIPFYTLEIRPDGTFIQCRGKNNCSMTKEVQEFKDKVVADFKKMIKKKERDAA